MTEPETKQAQQSQGPLESARESTEERVAEKVEIREPVHALLVGLFMVGFPPVCVWLLMMAVEHNLPYHLSAHYLPLACIIIYLAVASFLLADWSGCRRFDSASGPRPRRRLIYAGMAIMLFCTLLPAWLVFLGALSALPYLIAHTDLEVLCKLFPVVSLPVFNALIWRSLVRGKTHHPALLGLMSGSVLVVSAVFSLVFLLILVQAVEGIDYARHHPSLLAVLEFALLIAVVSTPFIVLASAVVFNFRIRSLDRGKTASSYAAAGVAITLAALFAGEFYPSLARSHIRAANSGEISEARAAVRTLRALGLQDNVLKYCYGITQPALPLSALMFGTLADEVRLPVDPEQSRKAYYRATGRLFNTVPHPSSWLPGWRLDNDRAGTSVGEIVPDVSLSSSRLSGTVSPEAAAGYIEWTLELRNTGSWEQEARAQIALPYGAVVSRATLWMNGVAHEAVFNERNLVRQAYQAVVARRRDPLLVTATSPDHVLIQCFPVPANGVMKLRLGISFPLLLEDPGMGSFRLPGLVEKNFSVATEHDVHVTGRGRMGGDDPLFQRSALTDARTEINARLDDESLRRPSATLWVARHPEQLSYSVPDHGSPSGHFIEQQIKQLRRRSPDNLFIVIDGSATMRPHIEELVRGLENVPASLRTEVRFASDEISGLSPDSAGVSAATLPRAIDELKKSPCLGGPDNSPALVEALSAAARRGNSAVLWIHGPQPVIFSALPSHTGAALAFKRSRTALYELEVEPGPNRLLENLVQDESARSQGMRFQPVPRRRSLSADLARFLQDLSGSRDAAVIVRSRLDRAPHSANANMAHSIESLWAADETARRLAAGDEEGAVSLASRYRIVTPVTGAVVLERRDQYEAFGLSPDSAGFGAEGIDSSASLPVESASGYTGGSPPIFSPFAGARDANLFGGDASAQSSTKGTASHGPMLQGATNGTLGSQAGGDSFQANRRGGGEAGSGSGAGDGQESSHKFTLPLTVLLIIAGAIVLALGLFRAFAIASRRREAHPPS